MNPKECPFCHKEPIYEDSAAHKDIFLLYTCRGCQKPRHDTLYRVLHRANSLELLSIAVELDEYYLVYKFVDPHTLLFHRYTIVYKDIVGVISKDPDHIPITLRSPVFEMEDILQLPLHDIRASKAKLDIYCTFS